MYKKVQSGISWGTVYLYIPQPYLQCWNGGSLQPHQSFQQTQEALNRNGNNHRGAPAVEVARGLTIVQLLFSFFHSYCTCLKTHLLFYIAYLTHLFGFLNISKRSRAGYVITLITDLRGRRYDPDLW